MAHVASKEGMIAAEHLSGLDTPMDYKKYTSLTYCNPEVASVGLTEEQAKNQGFEAKVGKFPFRVRKIYGFW